MLLTAMFAALALLSAALFVWQLVAAMRFPLHRRVTGAGRPPDVTLLKPLKGCDSETAACLRSWLQQDYSGRVEVLFGVGSADDPAGAAVRRLLAELPDRDAQLIVCPDSLGANAKVSTLVQLERHANHDLIIVSDADVRVPADLLTNIVAPLASSGTGLVHCFYQLANPATLAMRWEAVAVNADFWSQVLQSCSLKPMDFALGAAMAFRREALRQIGGFTALADHLADDYQLGHLIARAGRRIELCPVVVECREAPRSWGEVWRHQLRWARTIRVCQPLPWFFSILSNATLWPLLWCVAQPRLVVLGVVSVLLAWRIAGASWLHARLTRSAGHLLYAWLVPVRDLLGAVIWVGSFSANRVVWRGQEYRVAPGGKLARCRGAVL